MTCREAIEFLGAYVDGQLAPGVRLEFERHLAACPACSDYVESYRRTVQLAKASSPQPEESMPVEMPEELVKAILSAHRRR